MSYIVLKWVNPPTITGRPCKVSRVVLQSNAVMLPGVRKVNNKSGIVTLDAEDVGADPVGSAVDVRNDLQPQITGLSNTKLDAVDYVQHFLGVYASYAALATAHPTATDGDYAQIDSGVGFERLTAIWDSDDATWRIQQAGAASNTDEVPEGSNNLYFTGARVRSTPLTGLVNGPNSEIQATDQLLHALAKLQAQIIASAPTIIDQNIEIVQLQPVPFFGNGTVKLYDLNLSNDGLYEVNILFKLGFPQTSILPDISITLDESAPDDLFWSRPITQSGFQIAWYLRYSCVVTKNGNRVIISGQFIRLPASFTTYQSNLDFFVRDEQGRNNIEFKINVGGGQQFQGLEQIYTNVTFKQT